RALKRCHFSAIDSLENQLEEAKAGKGPTAFDWLVEIIRDHCEDGKQAEDGVELKLE
ncbi:MAG: barnase inhibitor, partial [Proteobacteria bacterium]|nr:barnase inhibitor [Pseudomonadota bacterium]